MKRVNVLHTSLKVAGNELAFLFPIRFNQKTLQNQFNVSIKYHNKVSESLYECNTLIISSWYFGRYDDHWVNSDKQEILFKSFFSGIKLR